MRKILRHYDQEGNREMENTNTNWGQSVCGVVIRDGKVLLARHTYGAGKGLFIVPGGYTEHGETPQDAMVREVFEETKVVVEPQRIIGIRFNPHDWYVAFSARYVSGEACSDGDENDAVVWMEFREALERSDVPDLTKKLIQCALREEKGFSLLPYEGKSKQGQGYLFGIDFAE